MSRTYLRFFIIFPAFILLCFFKEECLAQCNIIDIPTSEIVEKGEVFGQLQESIGDRKIKSSLMATWGLGKSWEMGMWLNHFTFNLRPHNTFLEIDKEVPEELPDVLFNVQKVWKIKSYYNIGIGSRTGVGLARDLGDMKFVTYNFLNNSFFIPDSDDRLVIGMYYANIPYAGDGTKLGIHIGLEKELVKDKLDIFAEFISGTTSMSVFNLGLQYNLPKKWSLDLGPQIPVPGASGSFGFVVQLAKN